MVSLLIHLLSIVLKGKAANTALGRMLILAPVSSRDLVKVIPLISLVIMGAPGSLFLIG